MKGESNLNTLLKTLKPTLNIGDFVFCPVKDVSTLALKEAVLIFKEEEAITLIIKKEIADRLELDYSFVSSWITLTVHSSLEAVGLTATFSKALFENNISCNVVAAFYHDHIFIDKKDTEKAMAVLNKLSSIENDRANKK
jgi:hypothetical protein